MNAFATLYMMIDATTKSNEKIAAMVNYFRQVEPADAAWAVYFLSGGKPRQVVPHNRLVQWALEQADIPEWLFGESYSAVGDIAETITLLLPDPVTDIGSSLPLHVWVTENLLPLRGMSAEVQRKAVLDAWGELNQDQRFLYNKLITGAFRVGVSQGLVTRALAQVSGLDVSVIAHRLMGNWQPDAGFYQAIISPQAGGIAQSQPYPFFLAHPLEVSSADQLGEISDWQAEWKWDGIRAQIIHRGDEVFIWSRGEELVTNRFPEIEVMGRNLPDGCVIDGEIIAWRDGTVLSFAQMQRRIGRLQLTPKITEEVPVVLMAFDLLEEKGMDIRNLPLYERRKRLEVIVDRVEDERLRLSPLVKASSWDGLHQLRAESRSRFVEGLMLKRLSSPYRTGRPKGDWWKWKVDPYTIDAVLIYAERGNGKRASLYTDYTFGLWDQQGKLIPFAKAYSGLTDDEIRQVDGFIRRNTLERFGPVRTVKPELVFELAFAGLQHSNRHKSGLAVRFPRILRWRQDKPASDADTLETAFQLLNHYETGGKEV